jgi:hypothetical protein
MHLVVAPRHGEGAVSAHRFRGGLGAASMVASALALLEERATATIVTATGHWRHSRSANGYELSCAPC